MPMDITRYPADWKSFSHHIRFVRAGGRCECTGQCRMHTPNPEPRRCTERHGHPGQWTRGNIVLTTAHLCACNPPCSNPQHVIAACQRCHLRIDLAKHAAASRQTARTKRAARHKNQLPLALQNP